MLTEQEFLKSPLFADIAYGEYLRMLSCFQAKERSFHSDEVIWDLTRETTDVVGIIERGEASLVRVDEEGNITVLEELSVGGVFGRTLAFGTAGEDALEVIGRTHCDVLFIDYSQVLKRCHNACTHHSMLVQNMLQLMADKAQSLSQRVDVLSRRTIRDKLLCYLRDRKSVV